MHPTSISPDYPDHELMGTVGDSATIRIALGKKVCPVERYSVRDDYANTEIQFSGCGGTLHDDPFLPVRASMFAL